MNNSAIVEQFLEYKRDNKGRADRTLQIYRLALERLIEFLDGKDLADAGDDDLVAFTGPWLAKRNIIANARRPYIAAVRQLYQWMFRRRLIASNPSSVVSYPKVAQKLPRMMTLANTEKLMWAPDFNSFAGVRDGAMIALLAGCGLRVSGLVKLNESNIIEQLVDGRRRLFLKVIEKRGRERMIPVPAEADLQLRVYMEHPQLKEIDRDLENGDRVLFVNTRHAGVNIKDYRGDRRRMTTRSALRMIVKYGKQCGIPEDQLHPHAIRHLYGTELTEADVHVLVQQQLMGHVDPKSTQIYTHLAARKLVKEVDRANPLAKIRTPTTEILQRLKS